MVLNKIYIVLIFCLIFNHTLFGSDNRDKYWIFFKDKGYSPVQQTEKVQRFTDSLSSRIKLRRSKGVFGKPIADVTDLPVNETYINTLISAGITPLVVSDWLNAISASLSKEQLIEIKQYNFIWRVQPVSKYTRSPLVHQAISKEQSQYSPAPTHKFNYGPSFEQNNLMKVPDVHDLGIEARGIIIGMLDTGFRHKSHTAFSTMRVLKEYDFIHNDGTTSNESTNNDASNQDDHGTKTLSSIGGFVEGTLIGPAFGASYLLAKTEEVKSETVIEEDFWVAGLEWLEINGADIVNSSLGYNDWYPYAALDGNTAITTIAADIAARKGVLVVNSMGNEGNQPGSIIAPADGDSVLSVGAVDPNGILTAFSSIGPTWDGRIKPDIVAQGSGIYVASPNSFNSFTYSSGTSFSSPLSAGAAALLLSAHPQLTAMDLRDILRMTAHNAKNPNNQYGWGIVNAYDAIFSVGLFFSNVPVITDTSSGYLVKINVLSHYNVITDSTYMFYSCDQSPYVKVAMVKSQQVDYRFEAIIPYRNEIGKIYLYFKATDESNYTKFHPYQAPELIFTFDPNSMSIDPGEQPIRPEEFVLYQNYPNPFNNLTTISYDMFVSARVSVQIYNLLGQRVKNLVDTFQTPNSYLIEWNGDDDNHNQVCSGIYVVAIRVGEDVETIKMLFLK